MVRTLTADRGDAGRRLDLVVRRHLSDLGSATRTRVQGWIAGGLVTVNGSPVTRAAARTLLGDVVRVAVPASDQPEPMRAEHAPLDIVYEDDHLLALDKPTGVVVHPTYRNTRGTIMNALLWYAQTWPAGLRPSLVGRLDKDTSGLLLVAKSAAVHRALQQAGETGRMDKDYLAIVRGRLTDRRSLDMPLARDPRDRRRVVVSSNGVRSLTIVEPLAVTSTPAAPLSLIRCRLVTGRTHQIRVHLSAAGLPIVGDPLYGSRGSVDDHSSVGRMVTAFSRQALHAWRLSFVHPASGALLSLAALVPDDMQHLLDRAQLVMSSPANAGTP